MTNLQIVFWLAVSLICFLLRWTFTCKTYINRTQLFIWYKHRCVTSYISRERPVSAEQHVHLLLAATESNSASYARTFRNDGFHSPRLNRRVIAAGRSTHTTASFEPSIEKGKETKDICERKMLLLSVINNFLMDSSPRRNHGHQSRLCHMYCQHFALNPPHWCFWRTDGQQMRRDSKFYPSIKFFSLLHLLPVLFLTSFGHSDLTIPHSRVQL